MFFLHYILFFFLYVKFPILFSKAERQITNDIDVDADIDVVPIGVKWIILLDGVFFSHLITQDTHSLDAPMHSS